jgi:hypothetical protein
MSIIFRDFVINEINTYCNKISVSEDSSSFIKILTSVKYNIYELCILKKLIETINGIAIYKMYNLNEVINIKYTNTSYLFEAYDRAEVENMKFLSEKLEFKNNANMVSSKFKIYQNKNINNNVIEIIHYTDKEDKKLKKLSRKDIITYCSNRIYNEYGQYVKSFHFSQTNSELKIYFVLFNKKESILMKSKIDECMKTISNKKSFNILLTDYLLF